MPEMALIEFSSILFLGIGSQWLAWRFRIPAILVLMICGFIAGPITGLLSPDDLLGPMLFPIVSLSVAVILFEGGLSLKIGDLQNIGKTVRNLVTVGAVINGAIIAAAAIWLMGLDIRLSILVGSILVVTGPTVIGPLLRQIRLKRDVSLVLKWEGIVIDPIGVVLALLVFEVILSTGLGNALHIIFWILTKTLFFGGIFGVLGAGAVIVMLRRYLVPDFLQESFTLTVVVIVFVMSNFLQHESGLFAVTAMGVILANQRYIHVKHIMAFKENLQIILLSALFIVLTARLPLRDLLTQIQPANLLFLMAVMFVARPISVLLSTIKSPFSIKERLFVGWVGPRGIVAGVVASFFAFRLKDAGFEGADQVVLLTFLVIVGTVSFNGLFTPVVARLFGVAFPREKGVLIAGANQLARAIAKAFVDAGVNIQLVDTNKSNVVAAKSEMLPAIQGSILSERILEEAELGSMGRLLALTPSDEVNLLSVMQYMEIFGRPRVYRLAPDDKSHNRKDAGRTLFQSGMTYTYLAARITAGSTIRAVSVTEDMTIEAFKEKYGPKIIPMFLVTDKRQVFVFSSDNQLLPKADQKIIALFPADAPPS